MIRQRSARHFIPLCRASAALHASLRQRVPYGVTILALPVYTIVRRPYGHRLSGYMYTSYSESMLTHVRTWLLGTISSTFHVLQCSAATTATVLLPEDGAIATSESERGVREMDKQHV